jgi:hypothetical protein
MNVGNGEVIDACRKVGGCVDTKGGGLGSSCRGK